ncbi:hypothetical protein [Natrinema sp. SYSU A 869]|uniref:hypothetical protein n=1 Tax=Natrinema sp. SYSU A 869 TaxID=2871694 RepID=UPI001CA3BB03|nr:hypothetical protein [Natrinema sp. SYSU A 869]
MVDIPVYNSSVPGSNDRSRALWQLLYATALTPILLLTEPSREIASIEATVAAVGLGLIVGAVVSLTLSGAQLGPQDDALATVVGIATVGGVTVLLWLLLPRDHISTFLHFAIAFLWGTALASAARHVVWPSLSSSESTE